MEGGATTCESYVCGRQSLGGVFYFSVERGESGGAV